MKFSVLILVYLGLHLNSTAQKVSISVTKARLIDVLQILAKQTGNSYPFAGDHEKSLPVTVNIVDATYIEALDIILKDQPFQYTQSGTIFTIKYNPDAPLIRQVNGKLRQQTTLHGTVLGTSDKRLEGAVIRLAGSAVIRGRTNQKGYFELENVPHIGTIIVSYPGYVPTEFTYIGNPANVRMKQKAVALPGTEIMSKKAGPVTSLVPLPQQDLYTGNISTVEGPDINNQVVDNPLLALRGQVAGLVAKQPNGIADAEPIVTVRGRNSIASGAGPLYIVDGVVISRFIYPELTIPGLVFSQISNIRPEDIKSFEVLKDAEATALYGSRGANGVIIIKTKRRTEDAFSIHVSISQGSGKVPRFLKLLNTADYVVLRKEAINNDGKVPGMGDPDVNGAWGETRYTDWQKVLLGNVSHIQNYRLNLSWHGTNAQYMAAGTYSRGTSVFPGDYYNKKASANVSTIHEIWKNKIQIAFSASFMSNDHQLPKEDFTPLVLLAPNAPEIYRSKDTLNWANGFYNPLGKSLQTSNSFTQYLLLNFSVTYNPFRNLYIMVNTGYNYILVNSRSHIPLSSLPPVSEYPEEQRAREVGRDQMNSWNIDPQAKYTIKWRNHHVDLLGGVTLLDSKQYSQMKTGRGYSSDRIMKDFDAATTITHTNSATQYRYNGYFGRIVYDLRQKYVLSFTYRRDGSNRVADDERMGAFWALGLAWLFYKERYFKDHMSWLTFAKIRGSIGKTGNDQIPENLYSGNYEQAPGYYGTPGLVNSQLNNPFLRWELTHKMEAGIELGFIHLFNVGISAYRHTTVDQLLRYDLPGTSGYQYIIANLPAKVGNKGLELEFVKKALNSGRKKLTWRFSLNFSLIQNKLLSFPGIERSFYAQRYEVGRSLDVKFLLKKEDKVDPVTGLYRFSKETYAVDFGPEFYGGMSNTFSCRGFELYILLQFVKQTGVSPVALTAAGRYVPAASNQLEESLDRWKVSGDQAKEQRASATDVAVYNSYINYTQSDARKVDASFFRINNLTFSYTMPEFKMGRALFSAKGSIQAQNVLTLTPYKGFNPETQSFGSMQLPPLRTCNFTIQVNIRK